MKQLAILFFLLCGGFFGIWTVKINTPVNRPDEYEEGYDENAGTWLAQRTVVDDDWRLDPEIPANYVPVPGEDELYMVIDNNGKIIEYRRRTKQLDGSWKWETVNPDIPEGYEPVEGLENVYKVTQADGTVKYLKYIRNDDDTYAFIEVDENGNPINQDMNAETIDSKHVQITGNTYKRLNDHGVVIGIEKRVKTPEGSFEWMSADLPDVSLSDQGNDMQNGSIGLGLPQLDTSGMEEMANNMNTLQQSPTIDDVTTSVYTETIPGGWAEQAYGGQGYDGSNQPAMVTNPDGTHTETEVTKEIRNIDGQKIVLETYVKYTYDEAGNLLSTQKEGPFEVDSQPTVIEEQKPVQGDRTSVAESLDSEYARVAAAYPYSQQIEGQVYALLNAQRAQNGLNPLQFSTEANKIARLRAADMAAYNVSTGDLPTYGTLGAMLSKFKITGTAPGENLWRTNSINADDIHARFQTVDTSRATRMNEKSTQYGLAIISQNGYLYICEVFL